MNTKEKAKDIFDKMYLNQEKSVLRGNRIQYANARNCALFMVDEIIQSHIDWSTEQDECIGFWEDVRRWLEKI